MTGLTNALSGVLKRRVLDKTDVSLTWRPDAPGFEQHPAFANRPSLFVVLEEELGLRLEAGKAPIDVLGIDHIERPSEN